MKESSKNEQSSIEEDVKILESIIKINNDYLKGVENQTINQNEIKAIEHVLSDYKRVLKENEHKTEKIENQKAELAILNEKQKNLNKLQNTLSSYKGQFRRQEKEIEKLKNKEATARKINKLLVQRYSNSISVQKVKDKIEELDIEISTCEYADDDSEEYKQEVEKNKAELLMAKKVLQQLLESEEEK